MIASMYVQIHYQQSFLSNSSFYHEKFTATPGGAVAGANSPPSAASSIAGGAADTGASTAASANAGPATATGQPSNGNGRGQGVSNFRPPFFGFLLNYIWIFSLAEVGTVGVNTMASNRAFYRFSFPMRTSMFLL